MVKITINQKDCIGCGLCSSLAPEIFENDEKDFKAKLKSNGSLTETASFELPDEQSRQVKEAVEGCPVQVINITE
jgi:ferredoxin